MLNAFHQDLKKNLPTLSIMFNFTLIIILNITLGTLDTTIGVTATIVMCITY